MSGFVFVYFKIIIEYYKHLSVQIGDVKTKGIPNMREPINLKSLEAKAVKECLKFYDTIITDCDAVLWHDNDVIPLVPETINSLKNMGKNIYFVTNNGLRTRHGLWEKAVKMNYNIDESHIIAPTYSIAEYLKQQLNTKDKVYVIGSMAISQELTNLDIENFGTGEDLIQSKWVEQLPKLNLDTESQQVKAVVVGFDEHFNFMKMLKASSFLNYNTNCLFLATNADAVHRYPKYCIPGTGAILKALETCVGQQAQIMGKPNPIICETLIKSGAIDVNKTLMVGDCPKSDVLFGKNCGFDTILVGTGNYKWSNVETMVQKKEVNFIPDYYLDSLGDLLKFLK